MDLEALTSMHTTILQGSSMFVGEFDAVYPTEDGREFFREENIKCKQQLIELNRTQQENFLIEKLKGNVGDYLIMDIINSMCP